MKLYGSLISPYVRKLRVLIAEKKLACEFVMVDPFAPDGPVQALNPLGLVPVLQRDGGLPLFDSPVIAEYLDSLTAPTLIPLAGEARWTVLRWAALGDGILDVAIVRTRELRRPVGQQSLEQIQRREYKIAHTLDFVDQHLGPGPYLVDGLTLADIAIAVALEYIDSRYPHDWRGRHRRLAAWLAPISGRTAFAETRLPN